MILNADRGAVTNDPQVAIITVVIVLENHVIVDLFRRPDRAILTAQFSKGVAPVSANQVRHSVFGIVCDVLWDGAGITLVIMGVARKNSMWPAFGILAAFIDFCQHNGAAAMLSAIRVWRVMNGDKDASSRILQTVELGGQESELHICERQGIALAGDDARIFKYIAVYTDDADKWSVEREINARLYLHCAGQAAGVR